MGPLVGVVFGSESDRPVMGEAIRVLRALSVVVLDRVVSAHRDPDGMFAYAEGAAACGLEVVIAGAGGAAHLPGMLASKTQLPVLGVPIPTNLAGGLDSLLSIVQMPAGVPVATFAVGVPGAVNAALFAARLLAPKYPEVAKALMTYQHQRGASGG